ncbi:hypothetical protein F5148DRAFT_1342358, partial [Russula earlei]
MTEKERAQERREIEERFGKDVGDVLRRARMAREATEQKRAVVSPEGGLVPSQADAGIGITIPSVTPGPPSPSPILSSSGTRPSTPARANRKLRFADVTPSDVHVYESAPPSPRRKPLALLPPSGDDLAVSLGQWSASGSIKSAGSSEPQIEVIAPNNDPSTASLSITSNGPPEEGTPEDIRRRFFPSLPTGDPTLEWIETTPAPDPAIPSLRFDLHGSPIPPEFALLCLDILAGIVRRLAGIRRGLSNEAKGMEELHGKEEEIRLRAVAVGADAIVERGSLGSRAVEVLWEALVGWDEELMSVDGTELRDDPPGNGPQDEEGEGALKGDAISSLQLRFFLPQISTIFGAADLPQLSLARLLAILQRLAMHSNAIADEITDTFSLITNLLRVFILTPLPPSENSPLPNPAAIQLLTTLASASRISASRLLEPADVLLRFLTSTPSSSPYPVSLSTNLITQTLRLYTTFAHYGLYAHIATPAAELLIRLSSYVLTP